MLTDFLVFLALVLDMVNKLHYVNFSILNDLSNYKVKRNVLCIDWTQKCFDIVFSYISTAIDVKKTKGADQMTLNFTGLRFHLSFKSFPHVSSDEFSVLNPIIMVKVDSFEKVSYFLDFFTCLILTKVLAELLKVDVPVLIGVYFNEYLPQLFVACVFDLTGEIDHHHFAKERPIVDLSHFH